MQPLNKNFTREGFWAQASYSLPIVLIVLASALRVFVCFQHNPMDYLFSDAARHWMVGVHFPLGGYSGAASPIGYQVYIFLLHKLTGDNKVLIALASAVLSVVMPWTYYRASRNFGMNKRPALWVWTLIAWTPSLLAIYHYIMMETLLLLLEGAALWMTARYLRKGGTEAFLTSIVFWTTACLTKPTVVPLAAICLLWSWWKKAPSWREVGAGTALALVMLVPQGIRSEIALGFIAPFGNPWLTNIQHRSGVKTLYLDFYTHSSKYVQSHVLPKYGEFFSSPSFYVEPLQPLSDWSKARTKDALTIAIDSAYGTRDWEEVDASVQPSREKWLANWGENIVLFFFAPSWPESTVPEWDGRLEYEARWMWAPLVIFVLVGNVRKWLGGQIELLPVAVTLLTLFLALQNVVTFEGRYRKPLEPLLLLNLVWILAPTAAGPRKTSEA